MADALHRTTKELFRSVDVGSVDSAVYLVFVKTRDNSDYTALVAANVPPRYWKIVAERLQEMTAAEKTADDAARAAAATAALDAARDAAANNYFDPVESFIRAFALVVLDAINAESAKNVEILNAIDAATSLADLKTRIAAIADPPQRTAAQLKTAIRAKLGT